MTQDPGRTAGVLSAIPTPEEAVTEDRRGDVQRRPGGHRRPGRRFDAGLHRAGHHRDGGLPVPAPDGHQGRPLHAAGGGPAPLIIGGAALYATPVTAESLTFLAVGLGILGLIEAAIYRVYVRGRTRGARLALPVMLLAPAVLGIAVLYIYPLLWELNVSFTKMNVRNFINPGLLGLTWEGTILEPFGAERDIFVGLDNYVNVLHRPRPQADRLLAAPGADPHLDRCLHRLPRHAGDRPGADAQPQASRPQPLPRHAHPAVGHPGLHLAADLAHRVQLPVRRREPAPGRSSASRRSSGCRIRS